jgi:hypothetical protein
LAKTFLGLLEGDDFSGFFIDRDIFVVDAGLL